jgi:hypothetical protein
MMIEWIKNNLVIIIIVLTLLIYHGIIIYIELHIDDFAIPIKGETEWALKLKK